MSDVSNIGGWEEEKLNYDSIMTLQNKTYLLVPIIQCTNEVHLLVQSLIHIYIAPFKFRTNCVIT